MKSLLVTSAILVIWVGIIMVVAGGWAMLFTYQNVAQEGIVTPDDASIPNAPVRGPFTLKAQADVIRTHTLRSTEGKTYAEMPRQVAEIGPDGKPVLGDDGKPVMVGNEARNLWITATTLTTALHLGIITYLFSGLVVLFGLILIWTGLVFRVLSKRC
jgi:hypothetical protein